MVNTKSHTQVSYTKHLRMTSHVTCSFVFSLYSCLCNPIVLTLVAATVDTILTFPDISVMDIIIRSGQVCTVVENHFNGA